MHKINPPLCVNIYQRSALPVVLLILPNQGSLTDSSSCPLKSDFPISQLAHEMCIYALRERRAIPIEELPHRANHAPKPAELNRCRQVEHFVEHRVGSLLRSMAGGKKGKFSVRKVSTDGVE